MFQYLWIFTAWLGTQVINLNPSLDLSRPNLLQVDQSDVSEFTKVKTGMYFEQDGLNSSARILLLSIYNNELSRVSRWKCFLLETNLNLWREIRSTEKAQLLQQDVHKLVLWSVENTLLISVRKYLTNSIGKDGPAAIFTSSGTPLPVADLRT